jgi:hypothetical protein
MEHGRPIEDRLDQITDPVLEPSGKIAIAPMNGPGG